MCLNQGANCPDGTPAAYFRYDPYGKLAAWKVTAGAAPTISAVAPGGELTDLLYTGQRWDGVVGTYYFGARFYDPQIASFLTEDSAREYSDPYAYVGWNPEKFVDPTGTLAEAIGVLGSGLAGLEALMALGACGGGCGSSSAAAFLAASVAGGEFATAGGTTSVNPLAQEIQSMVAAFVQLLAASGASGVQTGGQTSEGTTTPSQTSPSLTKASFIEGTNPEVKSPNEAVESAPSAGVDGLLRQLEIKGFQARSTLMAVARAVIGLHNPGLPFYAVLASTPAQVSDGGTIPAQGQSITFPATSIIADPGLETETLLLVGTNFGVQGPFLYGSPASSPGDIGLSAAITIYMSQLRGL